jgi:hypothetical protein
MEDRLKGSSNDRPNRWLCKHKTRKRNKRRQLRTNLYSLVFGCSELCAVRIPMSNVDILTFLILFDFHFSIVLAEIRKRVKLLISPCMWVFRHLLACPSLPLEDRVNLWRFSMSGKVFQLESNERDMSL